MMINVYLLLVFVLIDFNKMIDFDIVMILIIDIINT